jgi:hypothetical protein
VPRTGSAPMGRLGRTGALETREGRDRPEETLPGPRAALGGLQGRAAARGTLAGLPGRSGAHRVRRGRFRAAVASRSRVRAAAGGGDEARGPRGRVGTAPRRHRIDAVGPRRPERLTGRTGRSREAQSPGGGPPPGSHGPGQAVANE